MTWPIIFSGTIGLASQIAYGITQEQTIRSIPDIGFSRTLDSEKILVLVCAYNEEKCLPKLLSSLIGKDVLVIDDGSTDQTAKIAITYGAAVMTHDSRYGKPASLADGISFALQKSYDVVVEVDADTIQEEGSIMKLVTALDRPGVGGASCRQLPTGARNLAYYIDELIWAIMNKGKESQMRTHKSSHLGGVMIAFKPKLVDSVVGSINDDEELGLSLSRKGYETVFLNQAVAYFDASSCLGHLFERRRRMYAGHMRYKASTAPSMQVSTSLIAITKAVAERPKRIQSLLPTLVIELLARMSAWKDSRKPEKMQMYLRWVTTYAKNGVLDPRYSATR